MKTFEQAWAEKGYDYGRDELENVQLGWRMHEQAVAAELESLRARLEEMTAFANKLLASEGVQLIPNGGGS